MFKFLGKAFALLVLSIFFISSAQARDYKEGLDYEIRATNKTVEPEIREFFSFFCSHCFAMEKPFSQMAEFFKGKAKFIVNPVGLIGGDVGVESQKAYAVAINLEIEDELKASQDFGDNVPANQQYKITQMSSESKIFKRSKLFTEEALDNDFIISVSRFVGDLRNVKQIFNDYQLLIGNFEFLFDESKNIAKKIF